MSRSGSANKKWERLQTNGDILRFHAFGHLYDIYSKEAVVLICCSILAKLNGKSKRDGEKKGKNTSSSEVSSVIHANVIQKQNETYSWVWGSTLFLCPKSLDSPSRKSTLFIILNFCSFLILDTSIFFLTTVHTQNREIRSYFLFKLQTGSTIPAQNPLNLSIWNLGS